MIAPTLARSSASPLAAGATIPLSFIATGLGGALLGTGWLVATPGILALPHLHPHVIAFTHLWLLGALLTICFGAIYQLLPVLANTAFTGRSLAWSHLAVHIIGTIIMVGSFLHGNMGLVALGGIAVSAGVILFAVNVTRTLFAASKLDAVLLAFGCATAWLLVTVLVGVLLAANLHYGWWGVDVLAILRAHAHAGVAGFFVTLLQGATFRLVPMFTLGQPPDLPRVGLALAFAQVGLLVLTSALALGHHAASLAGAALLLGSFLLSGIELRRLWATRRKRRIEPGLAGFFLGLAFIVIAALGGVAISLGAGDLRAALAYGIVAVLGGIGASVQGMLCKIVPFLVWMRVYGPRVGRQPIPVATALGRGPMEKAWVWLHGVSTVVLAAGALCENLAVLAIGAALFAGGQVALSISFSAVARHLWRPVTPAATFTNLVKGLA